MDGARDSGAVNDAAARTAAPLSFAGPVRLIAGENASSYDDLLARVTAALKPVDIIEEIWVRDVADLVWDTLRLRRLKASLLAACAAEGLFEVLQALDVSDSYNTSHGWLARDPAAVQQVEATLTSAGMSMDTVMARTLSDRMDDIVRIDRMSMAAEARRSAILREIDRHRSGFGQRLRNAASEAERTELAAIENAPALEPA